MTKFTKGPWAFDFDNADDSGGGQWFKIVDQAGADILWFPYNSTESVHIEKEANAALIAAAPELYEALQYTLNCLKQTDVGSAHWEPARAALAKAEGKTP